MLGERDKREQERRRKIQFERIGRNCRGRGGEKNNGPFSSKRIVIMKHCDSERNGTNSLIFPDQTKSRLPALPFGVTELTKSNKTFGAETY
jgi:hypothetical protein